MRQESEEKEQPGEEFQQVLAVSGEKDNSTLAYWVNIKDHQLKAIIDTGAQVSLIAEEQAMALSMEIQPAPELRCVRVANGQELRVVGKTRVGLRYGTTMRPAEVFVTKDLQHPLLLGLPWIRQHAPLINWDDLSLMFANGEHWTQEDRTYQRCTKFGKIKDKPSSFFR